MQEIAYYSTSGRTVPAIDKGGENPLLAKIVEIGGKLLVNRNSNTTLGMLCEKGIVVLDRGKWVLVQNGQIKLRVYYDHGPKYDALFADLPVDQRHKFFNARRYEIEYDPSADDEIKITIDDVEV